MAGMAAWAFAGETVPAPAGGQRIATVIHTDARTGKLVRSVIVTSRPVAPRAVPSRLPSGAPSGVPSGPATEISVVPRVVNPVSLAPTEKQVSAPELAASRMPGSLHDAVERIAAEQELPPELIHSVIRVESNYNPNAVSPKGARGLMQLIPSTARRFGVADAFNPVDNIQGGAKYLKYLLDLYGGNYGLALAAYNAGEGAVARYGDIPPYPETRNYVQSVAQQFHQANSAKTKQPEPKQAVPAAGKSTRIVEIHEPDGTVRYVSQ